MKMRAALVLFLMPGWAAFAQNNNPEVLFQEAQQAQQNGDYPTAAKKYEEVIQINPNVVAAHANLGVVLVSLGRYDEAITQYHIALAEVPGNAPLQLDLGLAYYKKGDFAGAAAEFSSLHKASPENLRLTILLGNSEVQLGLVGEALALLQPLEKENLDNLDLEWALGMALIREGQTLEGLKRIQKVADEGRNAEAYQLAANFYLGLTFFDKARSDAEQVIRLNPNAPKAYVVLGLVDDYSGNQEGAAKEYEKALQINPKDLQARIQLAGDFYLERKLDAAQEQLNQVLVLDPNSYVARYELGRVERAQGNLPAALKDLETAEQESPDWLAPHVELTALYYRLNRPGDGDNQKKIVERLRAEERERRTKSHVISPQVHPQ